MEAALSDRIHHIGSQHQVWHVYFREAHSLFTGQPMQTADIEEALDLLVDAADGLDLAVLVDRTSHANILAKRQARQRTDQAEQLGCRGAIAVDAAIGLLKRQARSQTNRRILSVLA